MDFTLKTMDLYLKRWILHPKRWILHLKRWMLGHCYNAECDQETATLTVIMVRFSIVFHCFTTVLRLF